MKKKIGIAIMFLSVVMGTIFVPAYSVYAQAPGPAIVDTSDSNDYESRLQACSFGLAGEMNLSACLVEGVYYLILTPSAWFARTTGELFDYFIQYSLDTNSYRGHGNFIERGWSIVRDIGNVLFIFALLYIAITHILQAGTSGTKKFLINLIIAALLINFSLFFARVIIDAGNILARAFYNNIEIPNDDNIEYHTISQGIVMHVNPQRILGSDLFTPRHTTTEDGTPQALVGKVDNGYALVILGASAAVNITMGITFLSVALLFVGRVVGLWFLMIFSPFALASIAMPNGKSMFGQFSWDGWVGQTMKLSFMAPVFLFFLFLLIMFLQVIFQTNIPPENQSSAQQLIAVVIPFAMVIFILNKAKSVASDLAGDAGKAVKDVFGKAANYGLGAAGLAGGAALGITAFAGRQVLGRGASAMLDNQYFQNRVRLNSLRANTYEKKAKEATSPEEKRQLLASAAKARAAANRNAIAVKQLAGVKKSSFDVRRSDLLQKQIIGSAAGKAFGTQFGNLSKEFAGEKLKLAFGKGEDTNFGKIKSENAKEIAKNRLLTGQLYSKDVIGDESNKTLQDIKSSADKGLDSRDEVIANIDKYLKEIKDSEILSETEKSEKIKTAEIWKQVAKEANDNQYLKSINTGEGFITRVNDKGESVVDTIKFSSPENSKITGYSAKDAYAEHVQNLDWPQMQGMRSTGLTDKERKELVDKLRKGEKPKDSKDELFSKFAKMAKEEEGGHGKDDKKDHKKDEHKEDKHEPPKAAPAPSAPSGGGAHPPSGGGSHGHP